MEKRDTQDVQGVQDLQISETYQRTLVYIQLLLVMFSLVSFPYIVSEGVFYEETTNQENILFSFTSWFLNTLTKPVLPLASASGVGGCCGVSNTGALCTFTDKDSCEENFAAGATCESVSFCETGCCYNESAGIFDENVLESTCTLDWEADPFCNLPAATLGCCVLGENTRFETEGQCRLHSDVFALSADGEYDWRTGLTEVECIMLADAQKTGACIKSDNSCDVTTEGSCLSLGGEFHEGLLCTASELETACEMTEETTCVEGKDGVYFKDSCGNIGNIYDSKRAKDPTYWREKIEISDACTGPSGSQNSKSCGNCNRFDGGICAPAKLDDFNPDMGEYYCKDTSCTYTDYWGATHDYKNGESWCVYEGDIDEGKDAPGSRHYRYVCNNGVVQVEPCADYRNEICIQQDTLKGPASDFVDNVEFSNAYCRKNNAKHCIEIGEQSMAACNDEPDCMVRSVKVGGSFDFDICLPKYPEGFSFESEYQATGSQVCAISTRTCVVTYQPVLFGCICIDNCECLNEGHLNSQMDEVCTALGDCVGTQPVKNYYEDRPIRGEYAVYDSRIQKYMLAAGLKGGDYLGLGSALFEQSAFSGALFAGNLNEKNQPPVPEEDTSGQVLSGILTALGGLMAALGPVLQNTMVMIAGMALTLFGSLLGLLGGATCPAKYVDYTCNLYSPPSGGSTCDSCNANPDVPCTAYRCQALGAACEFINDGTEDELCVAAVDDGTFPVITHILTLDEIIKSENLFDFPELLEFIQNIKYNEISKNEIEITNLNGGCVDAYTSIPLSFTTSEPAQCKFDIEIEGEGYKDFDDMEHFVGLNTYTFNHTTFFQLPDPSHGVANGANETTSELKVYIKCKDRYGHEMPEYLDVNMCVNDGPDRTAPRIITSSPKSGEYVSFDATHVNMQLITNELSTCKWSSEENTEYKDMTNAFTCNDTFFTPSSTIGYVCNGKLPLNANTSTEHTYYVRCTDQPWLIGTEDEANRNSNAADTVYTFNTPGEKITIDSVSPLGETITLAQEASIKIEIETTNGAKNHSCSYSLNSFDSLITMYNTGSPGVHTQDLSLSPNPYTLYIECTDETGDSARSETQFRVFRKSALSLVSRVWESSGNIYFETQEEAECRYSEESCLFDFENGEALTGDGLTHRIFASKGKEYFVKCQDDLGNVPTGCSIVLSSV